MRYRIVFSARAEKAVAAMDAKLRARIVGKIDRLAADPYHSPNVTAMHGGGYRLKVGDWRVVYEIEDDRLVIMVVRIGHRREVYR